MPSSDITYCLFSPTCTKGKTCWRRIENARGDMVSQFSTKPDCYEQKENSNA